MVVFLFWMWYSHFIYFEVLLVFISAEFFFVELRLCDRMSLPLFFHRFIPIQNTTIHPVNYRRVWKDRATLMFGVRCYLQFRISCFHIRLHVLSRKSLRRISQIFNRNQFINLNFRAVGYNLSSYSNYPQKNFSLIFILFNLNFTSLS